VKGAQNWPAVSSAAGRSFLEPDLAGWDSFCGLVGSAAGALTGWQLVKLTWIAEGPRWARPKPLLGMPDPFRMPIVKTHPWRKGKGMDIKRAGSQASAKGPPEWFTGTVRIDPLFQAPDPALVQGASVTFEPGARTAWHTHPLGQTLIVTSGYGRAQRWGGAIEEIRPGDVVWFSPGEKHWHGASATTAMTHIAIQEKKDGKVVDWMEQVSDQQYQQG